MAYWIVVFCLLAELCFGEIQLKAEKTFYYGNIDKNVEMAFIIESSDNPIPKPESIEMSYSCENDKSFQVFANLKFTNGNPNPASYKVTKYEDRVKLSYSNDRVLFVLKELNTADINCMFQCEVIQTQFERKKTTVTLLIAEAPVIATSTVFSSRNYIKLGTTRRFPCQASGKPIPSVSWYSVDPLDDTATLIASVSPTDGEANLSIINAQKENLGVYKCIAKNVAGKVEKIINIIVTYLEYSENNTTYDEKAFAIGETFETKCPITGHSNGKLNYIWTDPKGQSVSSNPEYYREDLQIGDFGNYTCEVTSDGEKLVYTFNVKLSEKVGTTNPTGITGQKKDNGSINSASSIQLSLLTLLLQSLIVLLSH